VAANLYTTAAQEVTSALHAPAEYYVKNLQKSRLEGVQAIGNHPIIVGNETTLLLATLATKTPDWAINYHNQVALWKIKCATYYNEGSQKIPPVVTREQAGVETVKARNASSIAVYRGQVRLRLERLNQPTSLCP